jgi:hypothetical protein
MKSSLQIRTKKMSVDIQMHNHNMLRWAAMAIDTNEVLANSLIDCSSSTTLLLTDMLYLVTHPDSLVDLPVNAHIVLWDGVNSYIELLEANQNIASRKDLKFFVVGWLAGHMLEQQIRISPLYPSVAPDNATKWGALLPFSCRFNVPYQYRALASLLSFSRYFKNWIADAKRHSQLNKGGKIVFCGMVTPTEHQINLFFRGVDAPALKKACIALTELNYAVNTTAIDEVADKVVMNFKNVTLLSNADYACAYSVLNILHRIKTISLLNAKSDALFINETKSNRWIDPYDSFFYRNNLYLDFGSTRAPDAIYPRTLDMVMKGKRFVSLRYLPVGKTIDEYVEQLSIDDFIQICERDAKTVYQIHQQMFN